MEKIAGRFVLLWGWRRAVVAFVAGALVVFAQAPFDFFAICFLSFPVLVWLLDGATPEGDRGLFRRFRPAFVIGWWFGFGYFLAGLWWIGNALLVEAEEFAWALPFAVVVLPALLALFYGLACAAARLIWANDIGRIAALAAGFGIAEWLRAVLFTGFPWNAIGYAAMPVPLFMQQVAVIGLYSANAVAVFVFAMPALFGGRRDRTAGLVAVAVIVAAAAVYGSWRLGLSEPQEAKILNVRIVQPSTSQSGKWDATLRDANFAALLDLSANGADEDLNSPDLIVWPETAVPFLFTERPEALVAIGDMLAEDQLLLAGAVRLEEGGGDRPRVYNSMVVINSSGEITSAADKVHLVPFGEYLPFSDLLGSLGLRQLVTAPGMFTAGSARRVLEIGDGIGLLPMICYEIIFPGSIAETGGADAIVNLTNDAWYGDTPGPYQHFRQARVRAVEAGLPLIRSANNGVSAVVDARGRIVDAFDLNAVGRLDVAVQMVRMPVFPYRNYTFLAILLLFTTIACIRQLLSKTHPN